jgi:hypothetical protein
VACSRPTLLLFLAVLVLLTGLSSIAGAQPPTSPYGQSESFVLNTNRIGFADSGLLFLSAAPDPREMPMVVALGDPLPNPFNPRVTIPFFVGQRGKVELQIFDLRGRQVRTLVAADFEAGSYSRQWDGLTDGGKAAPGGVYLVRVKLAGATVSRKISLVK